MENIILDENSSKISNDTNIILNNTNKHFNIDNKKTYNFNQNSKKSFSTNYKKSENYFKKDNENLLKENNQLKINLGKRHHEIFNEISSSIINKTNNCDNINNYNSYRKIISFLTKKSKIEYVHTEKIKNSQPNKENLRKEYDFKDRKQIFPSLKMTTEKKQNHKFLDKMEICDMKNKKIDHEDSSLILENDNKEENKIKIINKQEENIWSLENEKYLNKELINENSSNNTKIQSNLKIKNLNSIVN